MAKETKNAPPPSEADEGTNKNINNQSIPQPAENVKPPNLNYVAAAEAFRKFADDYFRSYFGKVESVAICAGGGGVIYTLRAGGWEYEIKIKGRRNN